jgi:hypothetical protein
MLLLNNNFTRAPEQFLINSFVIGRSPASENNEQIDALLTTARFNF